MGVAEQCGHSTVIRFFRFDGSRSRLADVHSPACKPCWKEKTSQMFRNQKSDLRRIHLCLCLSSVLSLYFAGAASAQTTVSFQQGSGGYTGTLDVFVGPDGSGIPGDALGNLLGSDVPETFLDGRYFEISNTSADKQLLVHFDNIFGDGEGQIPPGAHIESAVFTLFTGEGSGSARSGGPYGVAQLLAPFSTSTGWADFGDGFSGPTFANGVANRPVDNGFRGPMEGSTFAANGQGSAQHADVTSIVRNWSNGEENHGLTVRAGTTDGWQVFSTGVSEISLRPKLEVTYDTPPAPRPKPPCCNRGPMAILARPWPACWRITRPMMARFSMKNSSTVRLLPVLVPITKR